MSQKKKSIALLLCICLVLVLLKNSIAVSAHSVHQCSAHGCSACLEIYRSCQPIDFSGSRDDVGILLFGLVFVCALLSSEGTRPVAHTLVSRKVRLDD